MPGRAQTSDRAPTSTWASASTRAPTKGVEMPPLGSTQSDYISPDPADTAPRAKTQLPSHHKGLPQTLLHGFQWCRHPEHARNNPVGHGNIGACTQCSTQKVPTKRSVYSTPNSNAGAIRTGWDSSSQPAVSVDTDEGRYAKVSKSNRQSVDVCAPRTLDMMNQGYYDRDVMSDLANRRRLGSNPRMSDSGMTEFSWTDQMDSERGRVRQPMSNRTMSHPRREGQTVISQMTPGSAMSNQSIHGQMTPGPGMASQSMHGQMTPGPGMVSPSMHGQMTPERGMVSHSQSMYDQMTPGHGMARQSMHGQMTPRPGRISQSMYDQMTPCHGMARQSMHGQMTPEHGMESQSMYGQMMPSHGTVSQSMRGQMTPGPGMFSQSMHRQMMSDYGMARQSMHRQMTPGHDMLSQSMQGQNMPGHGMASQSMHHQMTPEHGMARQSMHGQMTSGHGVEIQSMYSQKMSGHGMLSQSIHNLMALNAGNVGQSLTNDMPPYGYGVSGPMSNQNVSNRYAAGQSMAGQMRPNASRGEEPMTDQIMTDSNRSRRVINRRATLEETGPTETWLNSGALKQQTTCQIIPDKGMMGQFDVRQTTSRSDMMEQFVPREMTPDTRRMRHSLNSPVISDDVRDGQGVGRNPTAFEKLGKSQRSSKTGVVEHWVSSLTTPNTGMAERRVTDQTMSDAGMVTNYKTSDVSRSPSLIISDVRSVTSQMTSETSRVTNLMTSGASIVNHTTSHASIVPTQMTSHAGREPKMKSCSRLEGQSSGGQISPDAPRERSSSSLISNLDTSTLGTSLPNNTEDTSERTVLKVGKVLDARLGHNHRQRVADLTPERCCTEPSVTSQTKSLTGGHLVTHEKVQDSVQGHLVTHEKVQDSGRGHSVTHERVQDSGRLLNTHNQSETSNTGHYGTNGIKSEPEGDVQLVTSEITSDIESAGELPVNSIGNTRHVIPTLMVTDFDIKPTSLGHHGTSSVKLETTRDEDRKESRHLSNRDIKRKADTLTCASNTKDSKFTPTKEKVPKMSLDCPSTSEPATPAVIKESQITDTFKFSEKLRSKAWLNDLDSVIVLSLSDYENDDEIEGWDLKVEGKYCPTIEDVQTPLQEMIKDVQKCFHKNVLPKATAGTVARATESVPESRQELPKLNPECSPDNGLDIHPRPHPLRVSKTELDTDPWRPLTPESATSQTTPWTLVSDQDSSESTLSCQPPMSPVSDSVLPLSSEGERPQRHLENLPLKRPIEADDSVIVLDSSSEDESGDDTPSNEQQPKEKTSNNVPLTENESTRLEQWLSQQDIKSLAWGDMIRIAEELDRPVYCVSKWVFNKEGAELKYKRSGKLTEIDEEYMDEWLADYDEDPLLENHTAALESLAAEVGHSVGYIRRWLSERSMASYANKKVTDEQIDSAVSDQDSTLSCQLPLSPVSDSTACPSSEQDQAEGHIKLENFPLKKPPIEVDDSVILLDSSSDEESSDDTPSNGQQPKKKKSTSVPLTEKEMGRLEQWLSQQDIKSLAWGEIIKIAVELDRPVYCVSKWVLNKEGTELGYKHKGRLSKEDRAYMERWLADYDEDPLLKNDTAALESLADEVGHSVGCIKRSLAHRWVASQANKNVTDEQIATVASALSRSFSFVKNWMATYDAHRCHKSTSREVPPRDVEKVTCPKPVPLTVKRGLKYLKGVSQIAVQRLVDWTEKNDNIEPTLIEMKELAFAMDTKLSLIKKWFARLRMNEKRDKFRELCNTEI